MCPSQCHLFSVRSASRNVSSRPGTPTLLPPISLRGVPLRRSSHTVTGSCLANAWRAPSLGVLSASSSAVSPSSTQTDLRLSDLRHLGLPPRSGSIPSKYAYWSMKLAYLLGIRSFSVVTLLLFPPAPRLLLTLNDEIIQSYYTYNLRSGTKQNETDETLLKQEYER